MAKPFSIQSPEDIAKEYAGNKQKIAQAMQLGVVDPTAGVLAGMFIDRMRSAQMQEQVPQATVAQQVMGGLPPAPPASPSPTGGIGALPQGAPPMAPEMPAPEGAPMGMADGGLAALPVADTMFDEPDNGGYSGGGLVAFAAGDRVIDPIRLRRALRAQESSDDYGAINEDSGAMGGYQFMEPTARALAKRLGMEYRPDLMTGAGGRTKKGREYQERLMDEQMKDILAFSDGDLERAAAYHFAGPNERGWKGKTRRYQEDILRRYSGSKDDAAPEGIERRYEGMDPYDAPDVSSLLDNYKQLMELAGSRGGEKTKAFLEAAQLSPERRDEMKRMNEAAALAAASEAFSGPGPFLGQVGKALSKASGTLGEGKRDLRAAELEGLKAGMTEEQQAYLDRLALVNPALAARAVELEVQQKGLTRQASRDELQMRIEAEKDALRAKLDNDLEVAKAQGQDPDKVLFAMFMNGTQAEKELAKEYLGVRYPRAVSSGALSPEQIRANMEAGRGGAGGFTEGQTAKDTQGKTIVFQGGQWVYP